MNLELNLVALLTIVRKEVVRVLRIWVQTIVPPAITMTLYFIIFGNLIGRRIGTMDGFDYMQYIAPGLIMMSVITNSYGNVVSSFFGAKFARHVEEMLVSPMSNATIVLGHVAGGVLRGCLVGALVTVIALFFTRLDVQHPLITYPSCCLSSTVFSLAGFINAIFRARIRRHLDRADVRPDAIDLPRRRVLFHFALARILAERFTGQSDPVHGERLSLSASSARLISTLALPTRS